MTTPLRIAQIGFGGIGLTVAGMLADDPNFEYVAGSRGPIDWTPFKVSLSRPSL